MPAHVLARHVPEEEAPFHCVLCAVKVDDFAAMKTHISSARHRARLSMADDEAAATSLGRGLWVYHDEGLGADATALPIGESSRYWRLHQQASRMEVAEVSEEDLPIRPARTPATPVGGEEYVVLCEDAPWELPELLQFPSPLPEDVPEAQQVPSTVAPPTSEGSAPTSSNEQVKVPQSTAVPVPALEVMVSDEPGTAATSSVKLEPVAAAEDKLEPVATAEDKLEPVAAAEDKLEPVAAAEDTLVPVAAAEDKMEPVAAAEDKLEPVAAAEDKLEPVAAAEDKLEPVAVDVKPGLATVEPAPVAPGPSEAERVITLTKSCSPLYYRNCGPSL